MGAIGGARAGLKECEGIKKARHVGILALVISVFMTSKPDSGDRLPHVVVPSRNSPNDIVASSISYEVSVAASCSSTSIILSKGVPALLNTSASASMEGADQQQSVNFSDQLMKDLSNVISLPREAQITSLQAFLIFSSDISGMVTRIFMTHSSNEWF